MRLKVPLFKGDLGGSGIKHHHLRLFKHPLITGVSRLNYQSNDSDQLLTITNVKIAVVSSHRNDGG